MPTPRMDESFESSLNNINDMLSTQKESLNLLDKFFLIQSNRVAEMEEKFRQFHTLIKNEPELYTILNDTLLKSTKFQEWRKTLTPKQQEHFSLAVDADKTPGMYNIIMGTYPINAPIPLGNKEDGYATTDYIQRTQSHWLKHQLENETDVNKLNAAKQFETFIRDERVCVSKLGVLQGLLNQYLNDSKVSPKDKKQINTCLTLLTKHQDAYKEIKHHEMLIPETQSLDEVMSRFNKKYQGQAYAKYHHATENLVPLINTIGSLGGNYPHLPSNAVLLNAANVLMSRPAHALRLLKTSPIFNEALPTAYNRLASFDATKDVDTLLQGKPQRKDAAMSAILSSESVEITHPEIKDQPLSYQGAYLEKMLAEAFSSVFDRATGLFIIKHTSLSLEIYKALGLVEGANIHDLKNETLLNPQRFNAHDLETLAEKEKTNPLWHMLIMLKPVDNSFSIQDKIDACIHVIKHISAGEIKLNNSAPLDQTHLLAKYLLDLMNTPVNKTFTIEKQIERHLEVIQLIKSGQLKMDDQPMMKQVEDIAKAALAKVDAHGVYNPEITRLFVAIKKETDLSMATRAHKKIMKTLVGESPVTTDQNQSSIQKQLKGFLEGRRENVSSRGSDTDSTHDSDEEERIKPTKPPKPPKPR